MVLQTISIPLAELPHGHAHLLHAVPCPCAWQPPSVSSGGTSGTFAATRLTWLLANPPTDTPHLLPLHLLPRQEIHAHEQVGSHGAGGARGFAAEGEEEEEGKDGGLGLGESERGMSSGVECPLRRCSHKSAYSSLASMACNFALTSSTSTPKSKPAILPPDPTSHALHSLLRTPAALLATRSVRCARPPPPTSLAHADILICATSEDENIVFVKTKNLNGKTPLKSRHAVPALVHLRDAAVLGAPGTVFIGNESAPVDLTMTLLRGTVLRNTHRGLLPLSIVHWIDFTRPDPHHGMPSISLYGLSGAANVALLLFTCPNSLLLGKDPDECVTMQGERVPELSPVEDGERGSVEYSEFRVRGGVRVRV
ncbi:hypothetical protein B0H14DRAFT_3521120 [Mycena olivaceomarginata]|nr:hypothetical protein B0H14DRAFT_3521120 [Mycena olivaceomarginata]